MNKMSVILDVSQLGWQFNKYSVAMSGDLVHVEPLVFVFFFPPAMFGAIPEVCLMNH